MRRLATLLVVARVGVACLGEETGGPCPRDSTLTVEIASGWEDTLISAEGACTGVTCTQPVEAGCARWEGRMTSIDTDTGCTIIADPADGDPRGVAFFRSGNVCWAPISAGLRYPDFQ